jgi:hypothetical protein
VTSADKNKPAKAQKQWNTFCSAFLGLKIKVGAEYTFED